jgi:peroxiredoxin
MTITTPGAQAPSLNMVDASGQSHHLRDYAGNKNVVIVMLRGLW